MTEVFNPSRPPAFKKSLVLDDHTFYQKDSTSPLPVDAIYYYLAKGELGPVTRTPRIEDLDDAYKNRCIKYARDILNRLTRYEPCYYSSAQNRVSMNNLAHPIQRYMAKNENQEIPSAGRLAKDIEAIYGHGGEQLGFLLEQLDEYGHVNPGLRAEIEGSLSELTVFLLGARSLTDDPRSDYLMVPSTEAQDRAPVTADGLHHGFDLRVVRRCDNVDIPLQVKTSTVHVAQYPDDILVVSVAELVGDRSSTPRQLAEALYFDISGSRNCNSELIESASKHLFKAFDNYSCPE